jgi:XcyI-like restriction endonuclease
MAPSSVSSGISPPSPSRQLAFHELLVGARKTTLRDALREAVAAIDPNLLQEELSRYAPAKGRKILASAGIRDEEVFPTPVVLREAPTLVGYYRLLLGAPQKQFYTGASGMSPFKAMEQRGLMTDRAAAVLPAFCHEMGAVLSELVEQLSPTVTQRDIEELPLLTLGPQFQGSNNNRIGKAATVDVFLSIKEVVKDFVQEAGEQEIVIENSAGRAVHFVLSADPDVRIEEEFGEERRLLVAIEIKGGTDKSNAHNRAGEAEKSHQKARGVGFRECWTVIAKAGLDIELLKSESPTTNSWFDTAHVLGREGEDWDEFRTRIVGSAGIPA